MKKIFILIFITLFFAIFLKADEGMWLLNQLPMKKMKEKGLKLDENQVKALKDAVCIIDGGTGEFISKDGLILTNHHVAFGAIQFNSTSKTDYITSGFLAKNRSEELRAPDTKCLVLEDFKDVTKEVKSVIKKNMKPEAIGRAIEDKIKEIETREHKKSGLKCSVVPMFGGLNYYLFRYLEIKDVRLVYAPPRSIGNYGGEIDNWMWPRHTGDFSVFRVYVGKDGKPAPYSKDNIPYRPKKFLKISTAGINKGDYVMIMGYPGTTMRYETSYQIKYALDSKYGFRLKVFKDMIDILENAGKKNPEIKIRVAMKLKMLQNVYKNNQGMVEGLKKNRVYQVKKDLENNILKYYEKNNEKKYIEFSKLMKNFKDLTDEIGKKYKYYFLMSIMNFGSDLMNFANKIYNYSIEKSKPDLKRKPGYLSKDIPDLKRTLMFMGRNFNPEVDKKMTVYFLEAISDLPDEEVPEPIKDIYKFKKDKHGAIVNFVENMYKNSMLGNEKERMEMFEMTKNELLKTNDAAILFFSKLYPYYENLRSDFLGFSGKLTELTPKYIEAIRDYKHGELLYPDANRTLRLTYGTVRGYSPRDAVWYKYITTLTGVVEKDTGKPPFDMPAKLKKLYKSDVAKKYYDRNVKDVPVDFLADTDITGGNSGSPVMDKYGNLVGIAFDGNYESMSSDYLFSDKLTRTISVDIRYFLFILKEFSNAENIYKDLTLTDEK